MLRSVAIMRLASTILAVVSCVNALQIHKPDQLLWSSPNLKHQSSYRDITSISEEGRKEIELLLNYWQRNKRDVEENGYEDSLLNVTDRAVSHGYIAQEYTVETEDGFLLGLQRIRAEGSIDKRRIPVLLMHGLLQSAAVWLDGGAQTGLAYLLAQAGHDVWLGNARGNYYSRSHTKLDPDSNSTFWEFSADEIAKYDLPPLIDKVLLETGAEKLSYIGYSQGGGTFFMMCCEVPEYCAKVHGAIAIAPSSRHLRTRSVLFRLLTKFYRVNEEYLYKAGIFEALPKNGMLQQIFNFVCRHSDAGRQLCQTFADLLDSHHPRSFTKESLINMASNFPSGTSVRNMVRYSQAVSSRELRKFDYGPKKNMLMYGSNKAPTYNLSAVTAPVMVMYGRNDGIVDKRDVKWLMGKLPNSVEAVEVEDPFWNHLDVVYSHMVPTMLYPKIEEYLSVLEKLH